MLRAHRAIEVEDLDEMTEVLAAAQGSRVPRGTRLGVVTSSGGKAELMLDLIADAEVDLPPLSRTQLKDAIEHIGAFAGDGNPLDAWGNGDFAKNFPYALQLFNESDDHDVVILSADGADGNPMGHPERGLRYARTLADVAADKEKPHYFMGMRSSVLEQAVVDFLKSHDIPVVGGTRQGLGAITRLARAQKPLAPFLSYDPDIQAPTFPRRGTINEFDAKRLLENVGVPVCRERKATSLSEALYNAEAIGYPVVLKVAADDIPHKSELGLVATNLHSGAAFEAAWKRLKTTSEVLTPSAVPRVFIVQEMIRDGVEVFAGVKRDPDFGLVLAFGLGGIAIEILDDMVLRKLPLRQGDAIDMITSIRGAALLHGARAKHPFDIAALASCIENFSRYAWAVREVVEEIDLNPIIVKREGNGCTVVDALIVTRA
jgi:acyl-CoA synthetase (NDP forming)